MQLLGERGEQVRLYHVRRVCLRSAASALGSHTNPDLPNLLTSPDLPTYMTYLGLVLGPCEELSRQDSRIEVEGTPELVKGALNRVLKRCWAITWVQPRVNEPRPSSISSVTSREGQKSLV